MKKIFHPVPEQRERDGLYRGYTFSGWEYQEGWLISLRLINNNTQTSLWVDGSFRSPAFHTAPQIVLPSPDPVEVEADSIEITSAQKSIILGMLWEWEVWEPAKKAGTCAIECLERMLEMPREVLLDWFRTAGRNPSYPDDIVSVLTENGYIVDSAGPEGFGRFRDFRRLVSMFRKNDPSSGHVVLVYEEDRGIFDSSGVFKTVGDIIFSGIIGYDRGSVWRIEKA